MVKRFLLLSFLCLLVAIPMMAAKSFIYVTNTDRDVVDIIDPATNTIVQTIRDIPKPSDAAFSPDGTRAYIPSETSEHLLYVVDTKTLKTIDKVRLSGRPSMPAITKDGSKVYVVIEDPGPAVPVDQAPLQEDHYDNKNRKAVNGCNIDIVDTATLKVKTLVLRMPGFGGMHDITLSPDGKYMVAGCCERAKLGHFITAIDVQTEQVVWELPFPDPQKVCPIAIGRAPDGSIRIFPQVHAVRGFPVVDFNQRKVVDTIIFPETPRFVVGHHDQVPVKYESPDLIIEHGSDITPDEKTMWFASLESNGVFAYSLPDLKYLGFISLPTYKESDGHPDTSSFPFWITFDGEGKTGYVALLYLHEVDAIDVKTMKVIARIPSWDNSMMHVSTLVIP